MKTKKTEHMPETVNHTVRLVGASLSHAFHPDDVESVREHIVSKGYKQQGPSDVSGPASETTYVHPETKARAFLGKNNRSAWLDIEK